MLGLKSLFPVLRRSISSEKPLKSTSFQDYANFGSSGFLHTAQNGTASAQTSRRGTWVRAESNTMSEILVIGGQEVDNQQKTAEINIFSILC